MRTPLFYSLPPAGQKIPIPTLMRCLNGAGGTESNAKDRLEEYLGSKHLLFFSSGRAALWAALKAFARLKPEKREVIIPAYSCPSVVSATLKAGLRPVLCDVDPTDLGFEQDALARKINAGTLAVIVVHLYGYPARIGRARKLCSDSGSYLIEDAAQAFGNTYIEHPDIKLGIAGDAGFFSFGRGKTMNLMHGGILTLSSSDTYEEVIRIYEGLNECSALEKLGYFMSLMIYMLFSNPRLFWLPQMVPSLNLGGTVFEPEFRKARGLNFVGKMAACMLDTIEEEKSVRAENAAWYLSRLQEVLTGDNIAREGYPCLRYPFFVFDKEKRNRLLGTLVSMGTGATGSYPTPLNELPGLREVLSDATEYVHAKSISEAIITLPVHSRVKAQDRETIMGIVKKEFDEH